MQQRIQEGNALWHSFSNGCSDAERVPTADALPASVLSMRTQAEMPSVRQADTTEAFSDVLKVSLVLRLLNWYIHDDGRDRYTFRNQVACLPSLLVLFVQLRILTG